MPCLLQKKKKKKEEGKKKSNKLKLEHATNLVSQSDGTSHHNFSWSLLRFYLLQKVAYFWDLSCRAQHLSLSVKHGPKQSRRTRKCSVMQDIVSLITSTCNMVKYTALLPLFYVPSWLLPFFTDTGVFIMLALRSTSLDLPSVFSILFWILLYVSSSYSREFT